MGRLQTATVDETQTQTLPAGPSCTPRQELALSRRHFLAWKPLSTVLEIEKRSSA